jgi:hypothetical protein
MLIQKAGKQVGAPPPDRVAVRLSIRWGHKVPDPITLRYRNELGALIRAPSSRFFPRTRLLRSNAAPFRAIAADSGRQHAADARAPTRIYSLQFAHEPAAARPPELGTVVVSRGRPAAPRRSVPPFPAARMVHASCRSHTRPRGSGARAGCSAAADPVRPAARRRPARRRGPARGHRPSG